MDTKYIRDRITTLRNQKGVSEYKMSTDLGHSKSYIQSISSGKSLPSLPEFLYICEYLEVTPMEFFDDSLSYPSLVNQLYKLSNQLQKDDLELLISIANRLLIDDNDD